MKITKEIRLKISINTKKAMWTPTIRKKYLSAINSDSYRINKSNAAKKWWKNMDKKEAERIKNIFRTCNIGRIYTAEENKSNSLRLKKLWKNEKYRNNVIRKSIIGLNISPNNKEQQLINIIKLNNFKFKFVGNGLLVINGFNPDFVNNEDDKIIELYGDYWHKNTINKDRRRINSYKNNGYKTLVIWERELEKPNKVVEKIVNLMEKR